MLSSRNCIEFVWKNLNYPSLTLNIDWVYFLYNAKRDYRVIIIEPQTRVYA